MEITLKKVTHKERKNFKDAIFKSLKIKDTVDAISKTQDIREKFLVDHIEEDINLDDLPAQEVDKLFEELEKQADFHSGLGRLLDSNTPRTEDDQSTQ